jgi:hypothetical protein
LDLKFVKYFLIVAFDRTQSQEEPFTNFAIRESLGNESEYFQLTLTQGLYEGLGL